MKSYYHPKGKGFAPVERNVHPEMWSAAKQVLERDIITMNHFKVYSFLRKPYDDLNEVEMLPELKEKAKDVFAFYVVSMIRGDTNARIPLTNEQFCELRETTVFVGRKK